MGVEKRMFELEEGLSSKFWEIWCDNATVFTRFGKIGDKGQTKLKKHSSADVAQKALEQLVRDKNGDGYVQKGGKAVVDSSIKPLDAKALKKHLASLNDEASHLVFADWLQSQGHPWGELITLQHGIATATSDKKREQLQKASTKLLKERGTAIVGPAAQRKGSSFTWHLGLLRRATIGTSIEPKEILRDVKALLALPVAQKVEGVAINPVPATFQTQSDWYSSTDNLVTPWPDLTALAALLPEHVTHVGLGGWPAPSATAYVQMPNWSAVSKAFSKMRSLELTGWCPENPGRLQMSQLTDLAVRFSTAKEEGLAALSGSKLPKLERLTVWLGGSSNCVLDDVYPPKEYDEENEDAERYPSTFKGTDLDLLVNYDLETEIGPDPVKAFLTALPTTVKHLALQGARVTEEMFAAIVNHKALKQLTTLDLSGGRLNENEMKAMVKAKKSLAHLQTIDVSDNELEPGDIKKLTAALPNVRSTSQRVLGKHPEFFMRFVAVVE